MPEQLQKGMPEHEGYEVLCALAAGGLLEHAEIGDFLAHLKECGECRSDYEELSSLVNSELPQAQGGFRRTLAAMTAKPLPYSRERFLRRARAEGVVFSPEVEAQGRSGLWNFRPVAILAPVAALVVVAASLAVYQFRATPGTAAMQQIAELERKNSALTVSQSQLTESLAARQREIDDLRAQLGNAATAAENLRRDSEQARGEVERSSSQNVQLLDETNHQEKLLADARDEAARVNQLRISDESSIGEQQARIMELSDKLRIASATLDMERQLAAAGNDVRQLMVARQLHVIDVRDTDPNGHPGKAFGRVFLTEGKSLTFYAFDMNEDRAVNANRGFQVWAVPDAIKSSPRSLGLLRVDAEAQGRWVLKVDNPELVKGIGSVFITAESAAGGKQPSGQKMLYAYLGQTNHP